MTQNEIDFSDIKIVSFDIFDTLVHRLVLAPVDVFELVRLRAFEDPRSLLFHGELDGFAQTRMKAESHARARRMAEFGGEAEITFDEIYDQWRQETGASSDLVDWLKELELQCEARMLHASVEGKAVFDAARAMGLPIILISDMYLSSDFLREMLVAEGFDGVAEMPLFVSGEVRMSKHVGGLYTHVAASTDQTLGPHWLHIGDNMHSDVVKAREAGLSAHHATWAKIHNVPTIRTGARGSGNLLKSLMSALKEPHAQSRNPDDPLERIGYQVWGPMLFGFTCWLLSQFRSDRIDHAVFVARDGWLMAQLIEICIKRRPETALTSHYLYMSRQTGFKTGVRDWHPERAWFYAAGKNSTTARKAFAAAGLNAENHLAALKQFGIMDVAAILTDNLKPNVVQALNVAHMDVLRRNAANRKNLATFYDQALAGKSRVALVDIGWVGNIQRCFLHSLSDPAASGKVFGYYLGLHRDHIRLNAELGMSMQGWINGSDQYSVFNQALLSGGVELLEFILTAPHGSTVDLDVNDTGISPVLEEQGEQEKEHQALATRAQAGVLRFVEDYAFLLDWLSPETLSNRVWADAFLQLVNDPDEDALRCLAGITHSDGPGANDARLTLAPRLNGTTAQDLQQWEKARETAFWKVAFEKLNPKPDAHLS